MGMRNPLDLLPMHTEWMDLEGPARWYPRMLAVKKFYLCNEDAKGAARKLRGEFGLMAWREKNVRHWVQAFEETGQLQDKPRSGRKRKVPIERVMQCAKVLREGVLEDGETHHHWHTMDEAAEADPLFKTTCIEYGVKLKNLKDMCMEADPELAYRRESTKWDFSADECASRMTCAKELLDKFTKNNNFPATIFFLDEASVHLCDQTGRLVYCSKHGDRPLRLVSHVGNKFKQKCKWYIAVNARLGVFGPYFTTGTTGLPQQFMVRAAFYFCTLAAYSNKRKAQRVLVMGVGGKAQELGTCYSMHTQSLCPCSASATCAALDAAPPHRCCNLSLAAPAS